MKLLYNTRKRELKKEALQKEKLQVERYIQRIYHEFGIEIKYINWISLSEDDAKNLYAFYKQKKKETQL